MLQIVTTAGDQADRTAIYQCWAGICPTMLQARAVVTTTEKCNMRCRIFAALMAVQSVGLELGHFHHINAFIRGF